MATLKYSTIVFSGGSINTAVPLSLVGQPSGVAALDINGLVPINQLPASITYNGIQLNKMGQPGGVATLDVNTKIPKTQLPTDTLFTSSVGVANGVASLGSDGKVPLSQLPEMTGGGTGGAVDSVNGKTGHVTIKLSELKGNAYRLTESATVNSYDSIYVTSDNVVITLPSNPTQGDEIMIFVGNTISTQINGNGKLISSSIENMNIDVRHIGIKLVYFEINGTGNWLVH